MYYHDGVLYFPESYSRLLENATDFPVTPRDLQGHSSLRTQANPSGVYVVPRASLETPWSNYLWGQEDSGAESDPVGDLAKKFGRSNKRGRRRRRSKESSGPSSISLHSWQEQSPVKKKGSKHVYLKSEGRMERAGVIHEKGLGPVQEAWFADKRAMPQATADYLHRLGKLRDELIHQESENLNRSLERFREQTYNRTQVQSNVMQRQSNRTKRRSHKDQMYRMDASVARKGFAPPKLDPLRGEKMIEIPEALTTRSEPPIMNSSMSYENAHELINEQASRIDFRNLHRSLKPQQSIPNVHRRSFKKTQPLIMYGETSEMQNDEGHPMKSETFNRQMAVHQKDPKGIYKGHKHKNLLRADNDETDLNSEQYRLDIVESQDGSEAGGVISSFSYYVPSSSPVEWDRSTGMRYKLPRYPRGAAPQGNVPVTVRAIPPKHTWPSPRMPAQNNVNITRQNMKEYETHVQNHQDGGRSKACMFCTQPGLTQQLDYILFSRSPTMGSPRGGRVADHGLPPGTVINRPDPTPASHTSPPGEQADEDVVTADSLKSAKIRSAANSAPRSSPVSSVQEANRPDRAPEDTPSSGSRSDSPRKRLVVEMPNIELTGPTPQASMSPVEKSAPNPPPLMKEAKQNELREKEVESLMEDIKDLNKVDEELKNKLTTSDSFVISTE